MLKMCLKIINKLNHRALENIDEKKYIFYNIIGYKLNSGALVY